MFVQIGAIAHYILLMLLSKRKKNKSYTVDLMHIGYYLGFVVLLKGPWISTWWFHQPSLVINEFTNWAPAPGNEQARNEHADIW